MKPGAFISAFLAGGLIALLPACATARAGAATAADLEADAVSLEDAVEGSNAFALDLYREVAKDGDNLFFSPASVSLAMGFAYRGADGETAEQMARVMRYPGSPVSYLRAAGELDQTMNLSGEGRELRSANAFWVHKDLKLEPDYTADLEQKASGAFRRVDFTADPEAARKAINLWVAGQTEDRIANLIPPKVIRETTAAVLVNAIYWKADWLKPFRNEQTKTEPFTMSDGEKIDAELMNTRNDFRGIERGSVKLVDLPYKGEEVSMVAILPDRPDGLARLERTLSAGKLEKWLEELDQTEPRDTVLTVPKMSLDWSADLAKVIEAMGAPLPFSKQANFDRMARFPLTEDRMPTVTIGDKSTCGLTISNIIHQANIDVDEKGSEAAAATAVVMGTITVTSAKRGPPPPPPFIFRADHPLMFLLRDKRTGAILFVGRLVDPRQETTDGPAPDLSPDPVVSAAQGCPPKL
ncbi:MAG: serpin family protein [Erythrobacter sp.]|uniref:serpin family protein n=1 Tax=Erythrobacter sp. TaxID=1042 RepID=UPI00261739B7|nr:serpin family protein [Erythrobacter sp.]MDJ0979423.1 serpin family protein [Erythrobacter sp.]